MEPILEENETAASSWTDSNQTGYIFHTIGPPSSKTKPHHNKVTTTILDDSLDKHNAPTDNCEVERNDTKW